ncbi:MAG: ABC transporter ATP-binding protein [Actinomycetota bacterium]
MTSVEVRDLSAGYGPVRVLEGLDLTVPSGELLAVLGISGSGTPTLRRGLAGFLTPTAGQVRFGDRVVAGPGVFVPPERRRVGSVPQEGALFPHLDVSGNVAFGLPRGSQARVDEVLDMVGMRDFAHARPHDLSGGQQQRVALARALAPEPEVVLLDEPFTALDATMRVRLRAEVRDLLRELGTTAVLVTHDQEEALSTADLVAVMRDGVLVQVDTPEQVYDSPADLGVARFVGDAVILAATPTDAGRARCVLGEFPVRGELTASGTVVLRPEQLVLSCPVESAAPGQGVVRETSYRGHDALLQVELDDGTRIPVRVAGGSPPPRPGERVSVGVTGQARALPGNDSNHPA